MEVLLPCNLTRIMETSCQFASATARTSAAWLVGIRSPFDPDTFSPRLKICIAFESKETGAIPFKLDISPNRVHSKRIYVIIRPLWGRKYRERSSRGTIEWRHRIARFSRPLWFDLMNVMFSLPTSKSNGDSHGMDGRWRVIVIVEWLYWRSVPPTLCSAASGSTR